VVTCGVCIKVSLTENRMVPILPSKPQRPIAVAYDDVHHVVYWTDVRQRTISNYTLFTNNTRRISTVYLDSDGLWLRWQGGPKTLIR